ncbi:hypothetical protein FRB90_009922, partial [Tulasnella sp. 427]
LIWKQKNVWPSAIDGSSMGLVDRYLAISVVLYWLTIVALSLDIALSLYWSTFLFINACINYSHYPVVWVSHAQDFQWLSSTSRQSGPPTAAQSIAGRKREPPPSKSIRQNVSDWITSATMFRRFGALEPRSHSLIRGGIALLFWIALLAYGVLNCVINPIHQFSLPKGLPSKYLTQDLSAVDTYGRVSGFIAIDVMPANQFLSEFTSNTSPAFKAVCQVIQSGLRVAYGSPITGNGDWCPVGCSTQSFWNQGQFWEQIEAVWVCPAVWDLQGFRSSGDVPDDKPLIDIGWNSSVYSTTRLAALNVGLLSNNPKVPSQFAYKWNTMNPREWMPGITFNVTAGNSLEVDVGRRKVYVQGAGFLDLLGIPQ